MYRCNVCGYACSQLIEFNTHTLVHRGEPQYKPDVNDLACVRFCQLRTSSLVPYEEKQYKCDDCDHSTNSFYYSI